MPVTILPGLPLPEGAVGAPPAPNQPALTPTPSAPQPPLPQQPAAQPQVGHDTADSAVYATAASAPAASPVYAATQAPQAPVQVPQAAPAAAGAWTPDTGMPPEPPQIWSPSSGAPPEPPQSEAAKSGREVPGRVVALLAALVMIIAGGGYYVWHGHSSSGPETFTPPAAVPAPSAAPPAKGHAKGSGKSQKASHPKANHPKASHPKANHPKASHPAAKHPKSQPSKPKSAKASLPATPTTAEMTAIATTTFAPLAHALPGFSSSGSVRVETKRDLAKSEKSAAKLQHCLGQSVGGSSISAASPLFLAHPYAVSAGVDVYKSAGAAEQSIRAAASSRAPACLTTNVRHFIGKAPAGVTFTNIHVATLKAPAMAHTAGLQADFQVNYGGSRVVPGRLDLFTTAAGRATVDYYATGIGRAKTVSADVHVLKSLVAAARAAV